MKTELETEQSYQQLWKPKPAYENYKLIPQIVANEFLDTNAWDNLQNNALQSLIRFATQTVPYYRSVFENRNLKSADIKSPEDLTKLPILDRKSVIQAGKGIIAKQQPKNNNYNL